MRSSGALLLANVNRLALPMKLAIRCVGQRRSRRQATAERNSSTANCSSVRLAPVSRVHTIGPVRSSQPNTIPTTSGPAANPSDRLTEPSHSEKSPTRKPEREPEAEAHRVHLADPALGVAKVAGDLGHATPWDDDPAADPQLDVQVVARQQVEVAAADPCHHAVEPFAGVQVGDGAPARSRLESSTQR